MDAPSKTKYKYFGVVIDAPKEDPSTTETLRGYQARLDKQVDLLFYATIIHDKDTDENGNIKRPHLHAVLHFADSKTINQVLKSLETTLKCVKEAISVEGSNNAILLTQYLIHKNQPQKTQYNANEVKTNNQSLLDEFLTTIYVKPKTDEELLADALKSSRTAVELVDRIGLVNANKYRGLFNQIKAEERQDYDGLAKRYNDVLQNRDQIVNHMVHYLSLLQDPLSREDALAQLESELFWLQELCKI